MRARPLSITILAWVYMLTGLGGGFAHLRDIRTLAPFPSDIIPAEILAVAAVVCGIFLLRAQNWARWLAVVWIGIHVVISFFNSISEVAAHAVFCAVICYLLFRPAANAYFRQTE